jgi:hypothetical protein
MPDSNKSAVQVLKELKKERDELNAVIQALERKLGIPLSEFESSQDGGCEESETASTGSLVSIPIGFFHNLSQAAAAEKLLRLNHGQALTTAQILEIFKNSGMEVNPRNALTILYTALKRSHRFERVGSKAWGLKEWYPERKKKIAKEEKDPSDEEKGA